MPKGFNRITPLLPLFLMLSIIPSSPFHGCGSTSSVITAANATTRGMTGSLSSGTFAALKGSNKSAVAASCSGVQLSCVNYAGTATTADVAADCSFSITLTLNSFYYCGFFVEASSSFLGTLGCEENSAFAAALPIFADTSGGTDAINAGSGLAFSSGQVAASTICQQVDQDGDGLSDADDTDDDGDTVGDSSDSFNESGCETADTYDSDGDNIPDIFEALWASLVDADSDNIPNFCDFDVDGDGLDNDADSDDDGDGTIDSSDTDILGDGVVDSGDQDHDGVDDMHATSCSLTSCSNDFECQLYADDTLSDSDPDNDIGTDEIECVTSSGCCELIQPSSQP